MATFAIALTVFLLSSECSASIPDHCTDISYWDELSYETTSKQCCDTKLTQVCTSKTDKICEDVLELQCEVVAWGECQSTPTSTESTKCGVKYNDFEHQNCEEVTSSVTHTKKVPECNEVTKNNCVTYWEFDSNGNKVWAGTETCTPVTWEECDIVEKKVEFPTVKTECGVNYHIKWTEFVDVTANNVGLKSKCEVKKAVNCKHVVVNKCATVVWQECKMEPREECLAKVIHTPKQEKIHRKKCLTGDDKSEPGCEVHVGKSTSNTISATVTEGCVCPTVVKKGNWLGDGTYPEEFKVTQDGSSLQVQRTDSDIGWSMDLSFMCKRGIAKTGDGWRIVDSTVQVSTPSKAAPAGDHTKCCATCQAAAPDTTMYILSNFCKGNTGSTVGGQDLLQCKTGSAKTTVGDDITGRTGCPATGPGFIVDQKNGDDKNDGLATNTALKTMSRCIEMISSGEACFIRSGRYHESLSISGKNNIRILGYGDERPIIDGTVVLTPEEGMWENDDGVCRGTISQDVFQLFMDDEMMTNARWPNALWSDRTVFDNSFWAHSSAASTRGEMIDNGVAGLAESGLHMTGAMAVLNVGSWNTFVKPVVKHTPGTNSFTYLDDFGGIKFKASHNQYYLDSSLELLDNPGEWHYEQSSKVLRFMPVEGKCPGAGSGRIRGRTFDYGMEVKDTEGFTIANLTFFASAFNAQCESKKKCIDEIHLDSVDFKFASSSRRMLKDFSVPKWNVIHARWGHISVINCTFFGGEGSALQYDGENSKIYNNEFSWNDWSGQMGLTFNGGHGTIYSRGNNEEIVGNTLWYNGASSGIRPWLKPTIIGNRVVGQCYGMIMNDGSGIQLQIGPQTGAVVKQNWVHDSPKFAIRFDGTSLFGHGTTMVENVIWNTKALMCKGDEHTIENNLALGWPEPRQDCSLCVIHILRRYPDIMNSRSIVNNNAATLADGGKNVIDGGRYPLAGVKENNFSGEQLRKLLVDFDNLDFRPLDGTDLTDGDLIGPYPASDDDKITHYWIPGRQLYKTSVPIPANGAHVKSRDVLMCQIAYKCLVHHFYFGMNKKAVDEATEDSDEFKFAVENGGNVFRVPEGKEGSTYYWRVDGQDEWGNLHKGDTWMFTLY